MSFIFKEADRDQFDLVWEKRIEKVDKNVQLKWKFWRDETYYSIMRNDLKLWVALFDNNPIAQLYTVFKDKQTLSKTNGNTVYLRSFEIEDDFKNKGIFSKFIKHVLEKMKQLGYTFARVAVEIDNLVNQEMYKHWGFSKLIFEDKTIDINGYEQSVLILEKQL